VEQFAEDPVEDYESGAEEVAPPPSPKTPPKGGGLLGSAVGFQLLKGSAEGRAEPRAPLANSSPEDADKAGEVEVPDEPWMLFAPHEQLLWERVRPFAIRREAAEVRALRLPAAAVNRVARLNPSLQSTTPNAIEILSHATSMMLSAVAKAAAKEKHGGRVTGDDVRNVCTTFRELRFMHPLAASLDSSAFALRGDTTRGSSHVASAAPVAAGDVQGGLAADAERGLGSEKRLQPGGAHPDERMSKRQRPAAQGRKVATAQAAAAASAAGGAGNLMGFWRNTTAAA